MLTTLKYLVVLWVCWYQRKKDISQTSIKTGNRYLLDIA